MLAGGVATQRLQDDRAELRRGPDAAISDHGAKVDPSFLTRELNNGGIADAWRYEILSLVTVQYYGEGVDL
ncbi:ATPase AAA [Curtobacterium sp. ER1/6]|nr:ATPase AAA [Curtobacterium sp. ER1/6]